TTAMTVLVAMFIGTVYLSGLLVNWLHLTGLVAVYAGLANHFELLGYLIVTAFATACLVAAVIWRNPGLSARYGRWGLSVISSAARTRVRRYASSIVLAELFFSLYAMVIVASTAARRRNNRPSPAHVHNQEPPEHLPKIRIRPSS